MFVSTEEQVVFTGTPTNPQERAILAKAGFVHVTGLHYYHPFIEDTENNFIGKNLRHNELGKWAYNNGLTVLVTTGGEVWLRAGTIDPGSQAIAEFAPKGSGAFVPLSNGERISHYDLLFRMYNPNHGIALPVKS